MIFIGEVACRYNECLARYVKCLAKDTSLNQDNKKTYARLAEECVSGVVNCTELYSRQVNYRHLFKTGELYIVSLELRCGCENAVELLELRNLANPGPLVSQLCEHILGYQKTQIVAMLFSDIHRHTIVILFRDVHKDV